MIKINDIFKCDHCGRIVGPTMAKQNRNHCPHCLWSLHVDIRTGDRSCFCKGKMEPISLWIKPSREWALIHRCEKCGFIRTNRIAGDDNEKSLLQLAKRPMENPAFPVLKGIGT